MLQFETAVRLNADASPAEISARLTSLVAAPYSFAKNERRKPLRGRVSAQGGFLRWPLNDRRITSPRNLRFKFIDSNNGAVLVGKFAIWQPLRIVALLWLGCGLVGWTWTLIQDLLHHAGLNAAGKDLLFMVLLCCMAFGYLGLVVLLGRRRDADLIRILRAVLASEAGAEIVSGLLIRQTVKDLSFIDP